MPTAAASPPCPVVELRQYTLHPGRRESLVDLFDREFVETQEAVGMSVLGQFRDLDDADRFVWLRGFSDMPARQAGLAAFYGGPVWQAHRDAANATMVDSDNVLLLTPAWPGAGLELQGRRRAARGSTHQPPGVLEAHIDFLREPASDSFLAQCRDTLSPLTTRAGARMQAWYVTLDTPNNFPQLPVREGEPVLVRLALFDTLATLAHFHSNQQLAETRMALIEPRLARPTECHRLQPTARSALHA